MYVKNKMTRNPVTISKNVTIAEALDMFAANDFHRLPVTDSTNRLIGLITEGVIQANTPSQATSLSIHELNYILNKTNIESIMIKNVITIHPDALLEEAADKMRRHGINCLPVVDASHKLLGIITQKDIFGSFIELMGYYEEGSRIVVEVLEDKVGILANISALLAEKNINITNLAVYHDDVVNVVIRVSDTDGEKIRNLLEEAGYLVTDVRVNKAEK
ncbi:MAG: CBS domain-containing protein [Erysipelotrichaceae bacterium]|nr:CBS domain-containing protein [Erysipelotrichaceae bacterium]